MSEQASLYSFTPFLVKFQMIYFYNREKPVIYFKKKKENGLNDCTCTLQSQALMSLKQKGGPDRRTQRPPPSLSSGLGAFLKTQP